VTGRSVFSRSRATRALAIAAVIAVIVAIPTAHASAAPADVLLQVDQIGQQFTQTDPNNDNGAYDCLPASLTMAISALQSTTLSVGSGVGSYISVADGSRFAAGETIVVQSEHMVIHSISPHETVGAGFSRGIDGTSDLYVSRGADGTAIVAHPAGALVQRPADYGSVRRFMRSASTVPADQGLNYTYGVVEASTDHLFTADKTYQPTSAGNWQSLAATELAQGMPLVLYIIDASKLDDSTGQPPRPYNESFYGAHAVLLVGLVDGGTTVVIDDPWNEIKVQNPVGTGRQIRMTQDAFVKAWGNTTTSRGNDYPGAGWLYIRFRPSGADGPQAPIVTQAPGITRAPVITDAPKLSPPSAPGNLTGNRSDQETSSCAPSDPPDATCYPITLRWTKPAGVVSGYRIYVWWGFPASIVDDSATPISTAPCGAPGSYYQPDAPATVSASATAYTAFEYGTPGIDCIFIDAFNDAGSSSKVEFPLQ
jgi:hypothetical protein